MKWNAMAVCLSALVLAGPGGAQTELYTLHGSVPGAELGSSLAVVGDLDGDGSDDLLIGAPRDATAGTDAGACFVVSGRTGSVLHTLYGQGAGDFFGYSCAGLGDIDGDGTPDWIVGAPEVEYRAGYGGGFFQTPTGRGYAVVVSGATATPLTTFVGTGIGHALGFSVGGGGDADADGVGDLLIGAPSSNLPGLDGSVRLVSGATLALIRAHEMEDVGFAVTFLGDVDGDARAEYAASDLNPFGAPYPGVVRVWDGAGGNLLWIESGTWDEMLGHALLAPGDLDGDGVPDLVAGAPRDGGLTSFGQGYAEAFGGADGSVLWFTNFGVSFSGRGLSLARAPDLDGDGLPEVAVGQPGIEGGTGRETLVYSPKNSGPALWSLPPDGSTDRFGEALACGDFNGDGLLDLAIGAPADDDGGSDAGSVRILTLVQTPEIYCDAKANSLGCTPAIGWTGQPSVSIGSLRTSASQVLSGMNGILFWGLAPQQAPFQGGFLCVAPPTLRTPVQSSGGSQPPGSDCSGFYSLQWTPSFIAAQGLAAGDTVYCQYWSRDPASASGSGLTDALAFTLEP